MQGGKADQQAGQTLMGEMGGDEDPGQEGEHLRRKEEEGEEDGPGRGGQGQDVQQAVADHCRRLAVSYITVQYKQYIL